LFLVSCFSYRDQWIVIEPTRHTRRTSTEPEGENELPRPDVDHFDMTAVLFMTITSYL